MGKRRLANVLFIFLVVVATGLIRSGKSCQRLTLAFLIKVLLKRLLLTLTLSAGMCCHNRSICPPD